jgi:hypothetical protein
VARLLTTGGAATSRLSEVEIVSALARRARDGDIAPADSHRAIVALSADLAALHIVELLSEVTTQARALLQRHALRAADAIQLASCLYLAEQLGEPIPLVAFDNRLRAAARAEHLRVLPLRVARARLVRTITRSQDR